MSYTVKVAEFEGPFDLILYFIERDELDIYDIPIHKLTEDFLAYIRQMEQLNIDLASEFILVAATLMRIKAKMLLPRKEVNELGEEIDPREELIQKLIEYKKYKAVIEDLHLMAALQAQRFIRGNLKSETKRIYSSFSKELDLESVSLFKLMRVFQRTLSKLEERNEKLLHAIERYGYTIEDQKKWLVEKLLTVDKCDFEAAFMVCRDKLEAIFRFLAMLELVQERGLEIQLGLGINNFWIQSGPRILEINAQFSNIN